eukprot:s1728_g12.t1
MEQFQVAIDYADKEIKWDSGEWKAAPMGPKGEYIHRLAENAIGLMDQPVAQTLVPEGFYDHVKEIDLERTSPEYEKGDIEMDEPNSPTSPCTPISDSQAPKKIKISDGSCNLKRLTGIKLRMVMSQAENNDKIFAASATDDRASRSLKIWEVFAGKGRLTQILQEKDPNELIVAKNDGYKEELDEKRQIDYDTVLTFIAIVYEIQRRAGRDATMEHP